MHQQPTKFEVRRRHTFDFSINLPNDLDLWHFDLEQRYCPLGGQPWCFWVFSLSTYGPTPVIRTTWPCDMTFNLGVHGACWWYGSSCSICVLSLKFICLPGDLELWPFYLETCTWGVQPSYQFCCFWDFSFLTYGPTTVMDQQMYGPTWPSDFDLWPWRSCRLSVIRVFLLVCVPSLKVCMSINRPGDLDLLPFDL